MSSTPTPAGTDDCEAEEIVLWTQGDEDEDVWDDTELVDAYDAAINSYFEQQRRGKKRHRSSNNGSSSRGRNKRRVTFEDNAGDDGGDDEDYEVEEEEEEEEEGGKKGEEEEFDEEYAEEEEDYEVEEEEEEEEEGAPDETSARPPAYDGRGAKTSSPSSTSSMPTAAVGAGWHGGRQMAHSGGSGQQDAPVDVPLPPLPPEWLANEPLCNLVLSWYHCGFWSGRAVALAERS
eukprot:NODE_3725_length_928_cov_12.402730_g3425_i0.p1 GENE.NODE_3725_length_928_cov_12.402730_g3425_i0~~NODE_3725_length_928_cov_12.402730_g3425_i0.p1  ORF type:complete len:233 (+),score=75.57 NODE_3725_length_928_cov_12.402730_g3425_i0:138-836(+)